MSLDVTEAPKGDPSRPPSPSPACVHSVGGSHPGKPVCPGPAGRGRRQGGPRPHGRLHRSLVRPTQTSGLLTHRTGIINQRCNVAERVDICRPWRCMWCVAVKVERAGRSAGRRRRGDPRQGRCRHEGATARPAPRPRPRPPGLTCLDGRWPRFGIDWPSAFPFL